MATVTVRVKNHSHNGKRCRFGDKLTLDDDTAAMLASRSIVSMDAVTASADTAVPALAAAPASVTKNAIVLIPDGNATTTDNPQGV